MEENMHKDMGMYGRPVDLSFKDLKKMSDALILRPNNHQQPEKMDSVEKYVSCSMLLNNNQLPNIFGLLDILNHFLVQPMKLMWLDLSFNILTAIDPVLCETHELRSLYLHGNKITKIAEVDKLRELQHLRSITLHGNEIENQKGYRSHVISTLTHLKMMDFSAVTPDERVMCHRKILVKDSKKSCQ